MFEKTIIRAILILFIGLAAITCSGCRRSPQAKRDRFLADGKAQMARSDYQRAALDFRNAVQAMPGDAESYYQLGLAYTGTQDYLAAIAAFQKALSLNPHHVQAQLRIAQLMSGSNDPALLKDAENRLKTLPSSAEAMNTLALTELKLGQTDDAAQVLDRALRETPGALVPSVLLAKSKLVEHDSKAAEDVLRKACAGPQPAEAHRLLGEFYMSERRLADAQTELQRARSLNPGSGIALLDLGRVQYVMGEKDEAEQSFRQLGTFKSYQQLYPIFLFHEGKRDEAVRQFESLNKQNPDDREARSNLIEAYRSVNRAGDAERILDAALKKNSKDDDALLKRAEMQIGRGQYEEAERDLNDVIRLRPNSADAHFLLAKLHEARGQELTARQELAEALRLDPNLEKVRVELAERLLADKQAKAALDLLNGAPDSQKSSTASVVARNWVLLSINDLGEMRKGIDQGLAQRPTAALWLQDGLWKLRTGNETGARTSLEKALALNPGDTLALSALNQSYVALKQAAMGLKAVTGYASQQPKSADVQMLLGMTLIENGDRVNARKAFMAAKADDPRLTDADLALTQLDVAEGKVDDARSRLNSILSSNPRNSKAQLWLGILEDGTGNRQAAIDHYRKAIEIDPNNGQALNNLAYMLAGSQPAVALRYAQQARALEPGNANYADTLGWVLYQQGLYSTALMQLEYATSTGKSAISKYHLAMAYAKAGDSRKAHAALDEALKQAPNVPEAKLAEDVMRGTK
jgi:cellulose synthase operon protein C